jgi:hypothetical protein
VTQLQTSEALATTVPNAIEHPTVSQSDYELIGLLIGRGEEFPSEGDTEVARTILQLAAEANDAHAALPLGSTHAPIILAIPHARA